MPVSHLTPEHQRAAGSRRWSRSTQEQRDAHGRKMRLALAVKELVANWPELTYDQRAKLRAIFAGGGRNA